MKIKHLLSLAVMAALCFSIFQASAQEEKAEPVLFAVWETSVNPDMAATFDANAEKEAALYAKYNLPYSYNVFTTDEYTYYYVFQLKDFGDFGNLYQALSDLNQAAKEEADEVHQGYSGTFNNYTWKFFWYLPELSYFPETLVEGYEDFMFREWSFAFVKIGMQGEFKKISKEWVDLYKKYNVDRPFYMFKGDVGMDEPMYFWIMRGKDHVDFYSFGKKMSETMGEEVGPLWEKTTKLFRRIESQTGYLRKSLSYKVAEE